MSASFIDQSRTFQQKMRGRCIHLVFHLHIEGAELEISLTPTQGFVDNIRPKVARSLNRCSDNPPLTQKDARCSLAP